MSHSAMTKSHPELVPGAMHDLYVPRTNVGMNATPTSMIADGDFPTELQTVEVRPHELPILDLPEGSLEEGVSLAATLYPTHEY